MLKNQQFNFTFQNLQLLRSYLHSNLNVTDGWLIFQHTIKKHHMHGKLKLNHLSYYSGFNLLLTPNQNHCEISAQSIRKCLQILSQIPRSSQALP